MKLHGMWQRDPRAKFARGLSREMPPASEPLPRGLPPVPEAGDRRGAVKPAKGDLPARSFGLSTSEDLLEAHPQHGINFATSVRHVTLDLSSRTAGATARWTVGFTASPTGSLSAGRARVTFVIPSALRLPK